MGVIVAAALVVSCSVALPLTVTVPAVPAEIYPADTEGVTFCDVLVDAVIKPLEETVIVGFAVIVVAGVVALPDATDFEAAEE